MVSGIAASVVVFAVGAILDFAVTVSPYQHGFNIRTVGVILMIVGAVGFVLSLLALGLRWCGISQAPHDRRRRARQSGASRGHVHLDVCRRRGSHVHRIGYGRVDPYRVVHRHDDAKKQRLTIRRL